MNIILQSVIIPNRKIVCGGILFTVEPHLSKLDGTNPSLDRWNVLDKWNSTFSMDSVLYLMHIKRVGYARFHCTHPFSFCSWWLVNHFIHMYKTQSGTGSTSVFAWQGPPRSVVVHASPFLFSKVRLVTSSPLHSFCPAQLSGNEVDDLDYEQIEALLNSERKDPLTRAKKVIYRLVKRVGFFGILLCASVSYVCMWYTACI